MQLRLLFPLLIFLPLLSACKIEIKAPLGGAVTTESGKYFCEEGQTCTIDVKDILFDETFIGNPAPGYVFSNWRKKPRSLCGKKKNPCRLYTSVFEGNPLLMSFLDRDDVFYLEPVFTPMNDTGSTNISGFIDEGTLILMDIGGGIRDVAFAFGRAQDGDYDGDGIKDSYSFSFSNLPANRNFGLYLISEGKIYAVFGDNNGDSRPDSNAFFLMEGASINLGLIDWDRRKTGEVLPQFDLFGQGGVSARAPYRRIPISIERPSVEGMSHQQLVQAGMGALYSGWIGGANTYFSEVVNKVRPGISNEGNTARFFLSFSSLATLVSQTPSDGNQAPLDRVGDILDLLGFPNDLSRGSPYRLESDGNINQESVTAEQVTKYIDDTMRKNIDRSINLMEEISSTFNVSWRRHDTGERVENDYGDVLFTLGAMKLLKAYVAIFDAYDTSADFNSAAETFNDDNETNDETLEGFLVKNPSFLSLQDRSALTRARNLLLAAISNLEDAINEMESETDSQEDDLLRITSLDKDQVRRTREYLQKTRQSITSGNTVISTDDEGDRTKDLILNLQRFFSVGIDFRGDDLLPEIDGNAIDDSRPCLRDPTFNGVVISPNLDSIIYEQANCN